MMSLRRGIAGLVVGAVVSSCSSEDAAVETLHEAAELHEPVAAEPAPAPAPVTLAPDGSAGIPVLVFHQICAGACGPTDSYGVSRADFERMLLMIKRAGYATISMEDFVRAHAGDSRGLPRRPVLITFDDGRLDAYRGADGVLRALDLQATMFVITAEAGKNTKHSMPWADIEEASASGRWTIQLHAHGGHTKVQVRVGDGVQATEPFYAWRTCAQPVASCASLESFADWKDRAERDLDVGNELLASHLGHAGHRSLSFAVPYGEYGQKQTNDARIPIALRAMLDARFAVWFTQPGADPEFAKPSTSHEVGRYLVRSTTTVEALEAWLGRHATPRSAGPDAR
jgi:hypothetical protein